NSGNHVRAQIDAKNGDSTKGQWHVEDDEKEERRNFGNIRCQSVCNRLLEIVKDKSAFLNAGNDGGKVVIEQNHVSGLLGHIRAGNAHGYTNVGLFQSGRIVDTITSDGHNGTLALATFH